MKQWLTEIKAKDPNTGEDCRYYGPMVFAASKLQAEAYTKANIPYCKIVGQIIEAKQCDNGEIMYRYSTVTELEKSELN